MFVSSLFLFCFGLKPGVPNPMSAAQFRSVGFTELGRGDKSPSPLYACAFAYGHGMLAGGHGVLVRVPHSPMSVPRYLCMRTSTPRPSVSALCPPMHGPHHPNWSVVPKRLGTTALNHQGKEPYVESQARMAQPILRKT